jgi:hypothetical protein
VSSSDMIRGNIIKNSFSYVKMTMSQRSLDASTPDNHHDKNKNKGKPK